MDKQSNNKKILFLYTGKHPVHMAFAKEIGADIQKLSWKVPKGYDIYLSEGDYAKLSLLRATGSIPSKSKIIILFSDPRLFYLNSKQLFNEKKYNIKNNSKIKRLTAKFLLSKVDGVLCGSPLEQELFKKLGLRVPSKIIYPFISDKRLNTFKKIKPKLSSNNILFIGNGPDYYYKGIDLLIKTFKIIKNDFPKSKLYVLGEWKVKSEWKIKDVHFEGKKEDFTKYLEGCSLYLHMGRGEAFGVTIIEAMAAGMPAIVSNITGAKEVVKRADPRFIVDLNEGAAARQVKDYFSMNLASKEKLSKEFRKEAQKINEQAMLKLFKEQFKLLLGEIN